MAFELRVRVEPLAIARLDAPPEFVNVPLVRFKFDDIVRPSISVTAPELERLMVSVPNVFPEVLNCRDDPREPVPLMDKAEDEFE